MSNPFQDQLLKAGLVTKKQVKKANQDKSRNNKKKRAAATPVVDENTLRIQQAAENKAERDRELNRKKQQQAQQKATAIEIDRLIVTHCVARGDDCEIRYNFEHRKKVRRLLIDETMRQKIIDGKLVIASIAGRYELVPQEIASRIEKRDPTRLVSLATDGTDDDASDPYADYQVPDDLIW